MARVTAEDCIRKIPNRFELVMIAAQRARELGAGAPMLVDKDDDKNPVVALREIADGTLQLDHLREQLVRNLQKVPQADELDEEIADLMDGEQQFAAQLSAEDAPAMANMSDEGDQEAPPTDPDDGSEEIVAAAEDADMEGDLDLEIDEDGFGEADEDEVA